MLLPDVRSILFSNFAYTTVLALFLLFFGSRNYRRLPGLKWWTYGFIMMALAFLAGGPGTQLSPGLMYPVSHILVIAGFFAVKEGMARFFRSERRFSLDIAVFLAASIVLAALPERSLSYQLLTVSIASLATHILTIAMVWKDDSSGTVRLFFTIAALLQAVRATLSLLLPSGTDSPGVGWLTALISMLFFIVLMTVSFALISTTVRRLLNERDDLIEKAEHDSVTDGLTGLMNRRGFRTVYAVEEKRSGRRKSRMSFVVADIDDFRRINDTYGQDCGDEILRYIADVFRREFRGGDILVRWGGDEFLIVQPETDRDACSSSLERTRQAVAREPFRCGGDVFYVTMSFGYHTATAGEISFDEHLSRADDCMSAAKKGGRNRIIGDAD